MADGRTTVLPGAVRELRLRRFTLRVTEGIDRGKEFASTDGRDVTVGSAENNTLALADPTVSRYHFVLQVGPDGIVMRDLDSTNGTTVAGFRVGTAWLKPGATIGLGMTTIRYDELAGDIREPLSDIEQFGRAIGRSYAMRRLFAVLPRVAASETTVLLEGDTGTGKGVIAEALHMASPRAQGPFVVVDCGSIPPSLIESELFGHVRGAFTGAQTSRAGAFESAAGGTVFLDEIGELPIDMQPKLLRVLEERTVKRVGTVDPVKIDARVVAATNRNLKQAVNRGTFRSDLYFRLNIVRLEIPALRERREDIPLLVERFYEQFVGPGAVPPQHLIDHLTSLDWPGNVRELRNAVERALLMEDPDLWREITSTTDAAAATTATGEAVYQFDDSQSFRVAKERVTSQWERWFVTELLRRHGGNASKAARAARMDRTHLRELAIRYQVTTHK
jgi:DNA-binding NtrC family response regulator|nr:sigma 54-interacting transcriptional regulator [Kofleriaceae bacterium]